MTGKIKTETKIERTEETSRERFHPGLTQLDNHKSVLTLRLFLLLVVRRGDIPHSPSPHSCVSHTVLACRNASESDQTSSTDPVLLPTYLNIHPPPTSRLCLSPLVRVHLTPGLPLPLPLGLFLPRGRAEALGSGLGALSTSTGHGSTIAVRIRDSESVCLA